MGIFGLAELTVEQPQTFKLGEDVGAAAQLETIHREPANNVFNTEFRLAAAHRAVALIPPATGLPGAAESSGN